MDGKVGVRGWDTTRVSQVTSVKICPSLQAANLSHYADKGYRAYVRALALTWI